MPTEKASTHFTSGRPAAFEEGPQHLHVGDAARHLKSATCSGAACSAHHHHVEPQRATVGRRRQKSPSTHGHVGVASPARLARSRSRSSQGLAHVGSSGVQSVSMRASSCAYAGPNARSTPPTVRNRVKAESKGARDRDVVRVSRVFADGVGRIDEALERTPAPLAERLDLGLPLCGGLVLGGHRMEDHRAHPGRSLASRERLDGQVESVVPLGRSPGRHEHVDVREPCSESPARSCSPARRSIRM